MSPIEQTKEKAKIQIQYRKTIKNYNVWNIPSMVNVSII